MRWSKNRNGSTSLKLSSMSFCLYFSAGWLQKVFLSCIHEDFIKIISDFLVLKHLVSPKILELLLNNTGHKDGTDLVVFIFFFCSLMFSLIYMFYVKFFWHIVITILTVCQWDNINVPCNLSFHLAFVGHIPQKHENSWFSFMYSTLLVQFVF